MSAAAPSPPAPTIERFGDFGDNTQYGCERRITPESILKTVVPQPWASYPMAAGTREMAIPLDAASTVSMIMRMNTNHAYLAFALLVLIVPAGLGQSADVADDPIARSFERFDKNNDGTLTLDEAPQAQTFKVADANKDSQVSLQEFRDFSAGRSSRRGAVDPNQPPVTIASPSLSAEQRTRYELAADYSAKSNGFSLLVMVNDTIVFEQYTQGFTPETSYRLASGTKSFWGPLALVAQHEGLLTLNETVADTLSEWKGHPRKSKITVRQLLTFTSGLFPANDVLRGPGAANKFEYALTVPAKNEPGAQFRYGAAHLFAFGEFLSRKLEAAGQDPDPLAYLHAKVLDPIGLEVDSWSRDSAGNPQMPFGAFLTARQWAKFGQLILHRGEHDGRQLIPADTLPQVFEGTKANPRYGLNWWLPGNSKPQNGYKIPADAVSANGAGNQRLVVIPSLNMVVVRQGEDRRFSTAGLLARLLSGKPQ